MDWTDHIVDMTTLLKLSYRFIVILIKIVTSRFEKEDTLTLKFIWKGKRPRRAKTILTKKNTAERTCNT